MYHFCKVLQYDFLCSPVAINNLFTDTNSIKKFSAITDCVMNSVTQTSTKASAKHGFYHQTIASLYFSEK